ncbi:hypothetical protein [Halomonas sp. 707B3]|uniref:hypothetical protein n=1 Tax=Halomonas sp. 707B3 TaxID=1681043 RepID=UPI00209FFFF4|nr:hypothetical protein [Halomonas sp. 707B3]MCP1319800.1 hypothetical protein [Halomonas sp. 707B3]
MDEALFFSLQLEKFPGHEETMRQFAEANDILILPSNSGHWFKRSFGLQRPLG